MNNVKTVALFGAMIACVFGANWALSTFGMIPVGFGLLAPAGVLFAGLSFGLRDALHEAGGRRWVLLAIVVGALLSVKLGAAFAVASGLAFLLSETADLIVYTPLRERNLTLAVAASNLVGAVVDSAVFLLIAFGSMDFILGQVVGKTYMTLLALPVVYLVRRFSR